VPVTDRAKPCPGEIENWKWKMIDRRKNEILDLSFQFALDIIEVYKHLKNSNEYVMSKQLLRSGTSIGANINEAQAALTKKEFISKMSISLKESWETRYWLELLVKSKYLSDYKKNFQIQKDIESIINMLTKIIKSSQNNL